MLGSQPLAGSHIFQCFLNHIQEMVQPCQTFTEVFALSDRAFHRQRFHLNCCGQRQDFC